MKNKTGLLRGLVVALALMSALCITLTSVCLGNAALINSTLGVQTSRMVVVESEAGEKASTLYYGSAYDNLQKMYEAKTQLLREIAQEGTVLLKNDNATLPLAGGKVVVLGAENWKTFCERGGASTAGNMDHANLTEALLADGLTVSTDPAQMASSDAVIVLIGRLAGEGSDMPVGNLALNADELAMLDSAKASGKKVILVSSGDFSPELADQKADGKIGAILRIGNAGYRGAYGTADVITGKVSPSGKLVETMAADSTSSPAMENFGDFTYTNGSVIEASQAKKYVIYQEGIYYDYRYYETRYEDCVLKQGNAASAAGAKRGAVWNYDDEVLFPFGYGLSYTTFEQTLDSVIFNDAEHTAEVTVTVKNTGTVAGKDVVEIYAQSPYTDYDRQNLVEKSAVQLMGFGKTQTLQPGASETVKVTVHMQWLASYDANNAKTYILDAGDYYFAIGNGAHEALNHILAAKGANVAGNAACTYKWTQDTLDTTTYASSVYTDAPITNAFEDANINYWLDEADRITYLTRSDWAGTYPQPITIKASENLIAALSDTKRYENGVWNDTKSRAAVKEVKYAPSGSENVLSVLTLRERPYDDPAWDLILDNVTIEEISNIVANGRTGVMPVPSAMFPGAIGADSPTGLLNAYIYKDFDDTTGTPIAVEETDTVRDELTGKTVSVQGTGMNGAMYQSIPTLAATFNLELSYRQGEMFGEDCLYSGSEFIWGSGCNLHRTPFGGRAAEYYSADSVLTTLMAAAQTQGAQSRGAVLVNKHFGVNEQEQNRIGVCTFINEQTLRECELRAFEGLLTYGECKGLMGSYNRLGILNTSGEYDMMTTVLRTEWGSDCYVITDMCGPTVGLYDGNATIAAGVSTMLNNGAFDTVSQVSNMNTTLSPKSIANDPVLLTAARDACHRMMYAYVNSMAMNGVSANTRIEMITPWWQTALYALDIAFGAFAALVTVLYLIRVNNKKEEN